MAEENIIAGNVVLYGATAGEVYLRGMAGERFCVRNSGATAVVEGRGRSWLRVHDWRRAVVLGQTGRNFAAGMSGGIAYVLDVDGNFPSLVNREMVGLEDMSDPEDQEIVLGLVRKHVEYTGSTRGRWVLERWDELVNPTDDGPGRFVKVMPVDYKLALQKMKEEQVAAHG